MAIHPQKVTVTAGSWSQDADSWLSLAVRFPYLAGLRHQCEQGIAQLFYVWAGGELCGAFVLRIDSDGTIDEGVICAAAGELKGIDLMATILPVIEDKFKGCSAIRFHTSFPAVAKKMAWHGYAADEIVSRKVIHYG